MSTDTCRVVTTRVSSPPPDEAVLALSFHWGERLVSLEHLAVGEHAKGVVGAGAPAITWDGTTPRLQVPGELDAAVRAGEALEVPLQSGLTLRARLHRREVAAAAGEPSGEQLLFFRVTAFATLGLIAAVAMMVVTPVVDDDEDSAFFGGPELGPSAHFVEPSPLPKHVFDAVPAPVDPGRVGKTGEPTSEPKLAATASDATPGDKKAKVNDLLRQMMGGGSALNVATAGFGGELDAALNALSGPTSTAQLDGLGGIGSRGGGPGAGTAGLGIGGVGTVGGSRGPGSFGLLSGHKAVSIVCRYPVNIADASGYSREEVLRVVKRHQSEIRFCYESALQQHPELAGKVTARWVIAPTGDVETAEIAESSLGEPTAEACILQRVKRWRFPQPKGGEVVINFPWVFSVAGSGEDGEAP